MALYQGSGEWWETGIRIWVKPTLRGQAGGETETFPQEKPGNHGNPEFVLFWFLLQGWSAEGMWLRDTRLEAHQDQGKKSLLSLGHGLRPQQFPEGLGCRPWRGAVMCHPQAADGGEGLGGNGVICLSGVFICLLRSKVGKTPRQVEPAVEGLRSASFTDLGSVLFSPGQITSPSSAFPPYICRTCGPRLLHSCASMGFLRWPQIVAKPVLEWKSPQHIPSSCLSVAAKGRKARLCRPRHRLC